MLLVVDEAAIKGIVEEWLGPVALRRLEGGMNSAAWRVETGDGSRFVVKASAASDAAGLAVAETLQEHQFPAGGPLRMLTTEEGELVRFDDLKPFVGYRRDPEGARYQPWDPRIRWPTTGGRPEPPGTGSFRGCFLL